MAKGAAQQLIQLLDTNLEPKEVAVSDGFTGFKIMVVLRWFGMVWDSFSIYLFIFHKLMSAVAVAVHP